ncbi:MAG TPA: sialidase family protein [Gemmatimonadales bacterium]|nr:sialidase family protein [Gemmatimonadales bacterium]
MTRLSPWSLTGVSLLGVLGGCSRAQPTFVLSPTVQVVAADETIQNPALAVDPVRNRVYVAWSVYPKEDEGTDYLAVSNDGGRTFGSPIRFGERSEAQQPRLRVTTDGTLFLIWTHRNPHDLLDPKDASSYTTEQRLATSADGGRTLSPPIVVSGKPEVPVAYFMAAAVNPNAKDLSVAWYDYTPPGARPGRSPADLRDATAIYATTSHDGGRTFSRPQKLADTICVCCTATGIVRQDHPAFVLRGFVAGAGTVADVRDPIILGSTDRGDHWNPPVTIHRDNFRLNACPHLGPGATVDATGRVHVTWWTGAAGRAGYWYASSGDGIHFSTPAKLVDETTDMHGNDLSVAVDGENTAWAIAVSRPRSPSDSDEETPLGLIRLWAIARDGRPAPVDQLDARGSHPVVGAAEQGAILIWTEGKKILLQRISRERG